MGKVKELINKASSYCSVEPVMIPESTDFIDAFKLPIEKAYFLNEIDYRLLRESKLWGYKGIAISVFSPYVKESKYWSSKKIEFICAEPDLNSEKKGYKKSSCAIWSIISCLGDGAGCGNSHQYQLLFSHKYTKASYILVNNNWYIHDWINVIIKQTNNKLMILENTENHINNIKIIIDEVIKIQTLIDEEAFLIVFEKHNIWVDAISRAKRHLSIKNFNFDTEDIKIIKLEKSIKNFNFDTEDIKIINLEKLLKSLKLKLTSEKFGI